MERTYGERNYTASEGDYRGMSEASQYASTPIELYEFQRGATYYRQTSGDADVVYNGVTYTAYPLKRNRLISSSDVSQAALTIATARNNPLVSAMTLDSTMVVTLIIRRGQEGVYLPIWVGRLTLVGFEGEEAMITGESLLTAYKRDLLTDYYQLLCPVPLFSAECGLSGATYRYVGNISVVSGLDITIPGLSGKANGYYTGGSVVVSWNTYRTIEAHSGDVITLDMPGAHITAGANCYVYPGCDHTPADCLEKYNNIINYRGFPYIPTKNPFMGLGYNMSGGPGGSTLR